MEILSQFLNLYLPPYKQALLTVGKLCYSCQGRNSTYLEYFSSIPIVLLWDCNAVNRPSNEKDMGNKFVNPNRIHLLCSTDMEVPLPVPMKLVPGILMKSRRSSKWSVNLDNRFWSWNLEIIVWAVTGSAVRKSVLQTDVVKTYLLNLCNPLGWDFCSWRTSSLE